MIRSTRPPFIALSSLMASLVALCLASASIDATTLKQMSLSDLSHAAQLIVRARCEASTAQWEAGEIWTFTTFTVQESWKGSAPAQLTVRLIGGTSGNLTSTVSGVPRFAPGEDVVLFLQRTTPHDFSIVGWVQGTFRIRNHRSSAQEVVTQDSAAFAVFVPASRRFETTGIRKMNLDSFRALVLASFQPTKGNQP